MTAGRNTLRIPLPLDSPRDSALETHSVLGHTNSAPVLTTAVAGLLVCTFVTRASLLPYVSGETLSSILSFGTVVALLLAATYAAVDGLGRINPWGVLLLVGTAASLPHCERFDFALTRWLGWLILLLLLGPVRSTCRMRAFRRQAYTILSSVFLAISVLSALWWLFALPNLGRGDFTGVMAHSMTLGPVAGLVGLLALIRGVQRGRPLDFFLYAVCIMVCMLASSRAALAAMTAGSLIIIALRWKKSPLISFLTVTSAAMILVYPTAAIEVVTMAVPGQLTEGLDRKNWQHTREHLWQARWDEFCSSPLTGIGFVSAWEDTAGFDDETGAVETGSSYLAMLSMTGCFGAGAGLLLALSIARRAIAAWPVLHERQRLFICGLAPFWLVHLGAEGYIYGVSSTMGLAFWLWMGRVHDDLFEVAIRKSRRRRQRAIEMRPRLSFAAQHLGNAA